MEEGVKVLVPANSRQSAPAPDGDVRAREETAEWMDKQAAKADEAAQDARLSGDEWQRETLAEELRVRASRFRQAAAAALRSPVAQQAGDGAESPS